MDVDLHLHSSASDGALAPEALVEAAVRARLDVIALTDHDTVSGIPAAIEAALGENIAVIPGIEISTSLDDVELHILGYFVDPTDAALLAHTGKASARREDRLREMVLRLAEEGVEVPLELVWEFVGEGASPGRPHLARALVQIGAVESFPAAFDRLIGNAHPAYVPTRLIDPEGACNLIREAGGVSVWAHPHERQLEPLLPGLVAGGLDGVEVYRPWLSQDRMTRIEAAALRHGLMVTGGSDWHGPDGAALGEFRLDASQVSEFLARGRM